MVARSVCVLLAAFLAACAVPDGATDDRYTPEARRGPVGHAHPTWVTLTARPSVRPRAARETPRTTRSHRPTARPTHHDGLDWAALAQCESSGNPRAVSRTGRFRGLYQFDLSTWGSNGGWAYSRDPIDATPAEQLAVAQALYQRRGRSPWPVCGARL